MSTKKLKYTAELGEQFIDWNAAQNVKDTDGKVQFQDWRSEMNKIRSCLLFSKTSRRQYALNECPNRWEEFLEMKQGNTVVHEDNQEELLNENEETELWDEYCEDDDEDEDYYMYEEKLREAEWKQSQERGKAQVSKFNNKWRKKLI